MRKIIFLAVALALCMVLLAVPVMAENADSAAAAPAMGTPCAGSPDTRLATATEARVAQRFSTLRAAPASSNVLAIIPGGTVLEIIAPPASAPAPFNVPGPLCYGYGPLTWYYVRYTPSSGPALQGWVSEAQNYSIWGNFQYWLEPVTAPPPPPPPPTLPPKIALGAACPGAPASRLRDSSLPNNTARVAQVYSSLRSDYRVGNTVLRVQRQPETMTVLYGPFCSFGPYNWYQVRNNVTNQVGFVTEGTGRTYWLAPVP